MIQGFERAESALEEEITNRRTCLADISRLGSCPSVNLTTP